MTQLTETIAHLAQPRAGQTVTVAVEADGVAFALGFEPDPNAIAKNGRDLEFSFEDGGKIVLQGYYDHLADNTAPSMILQSGEELAGEDFLASLREDMATAAGPGAGSSTFGGGAGEYADDAGSLISGLQGLAALGPISGDAGDAPTAFGSVAFSAFEAAAQQGMTFVTPEDSLTPTAPPAPLAPAGSAPLTEVPATDMNALFLIQISAFGEIGVSGQNYAAVMERIETLLADFCQGLEGQNVGTVNFGAVLFAGSAKYVCELGPIELNPDDPVSVTAALAELQTQIAEIAADPNNNRTTNYAVAFDAALGYVEDNAEAWSDPDVVNKMFFIARGINTSSINDAAMESYQALLDYVNGLSGSDLEVHALGSYAGYSNANCATSFLQYVQNLELVDNTSAANDGSGQSAVVGSHTLLAKLLFAAATGNEFQAMTLTENTDVEGDGNNLAYLSKKLSATFGDGEDIVYVGGTGSSVTTNGGDDYVNGLTFNTLRIDTGDGDDHVIIDGHSAKVSLGEGNDIIDIGGGFGRGAGAVVDGGAGDDHFIVRTYSNTLTLGEGADTVELHFKADDTSGANTITDFEYATDTLDISNIVSFVGELTGNNSLSLEDYLKDYTTYEVKGDDLHITFNQAEGQDAADLPYMQVVLKDFSGDAASFSSEEAALNTLLTIMGSTA